jgi:hypothetical protein
VQFGPKVAQTFEGLYEKGVARNHAMVAREILDLRLPNFSGHCPARDENDNLPFSRVKVVKLYAITGLEKSVVSFSSAYGNRD